MRLDHATTLPSGDESCGRANFIVAEQPIRFGTDRATEGLRSGVLARILATSEAIATIIGLMTRGRVAYHPVLDAASGPPILVVE